MALKLYDTLNPSGNFPLVEAKDVSMPDGTRLSDFNPSVGEEVLEEIEALKAQDQESSEQITALSGRVTALENVGLSEEVVLAEQETGVFFLDPNMGMYYIGQAEWFALQNGETYRILWDGEEYTCVAFGMAYSGYDAIALGNEKYFKGESTDIVEPFVIYQVTSNNHCVLMSTRDTEARSHTVAIYHVTGSSLSEQVESLDNRVYGIEGRVDTLETPAMTVDMTNFGTGVIKEIKSDGSEVTYTFFFDDDGNPVQINDTNGNSTELIGFGQMSYKSAEGVSF